MCVHVCNLCKPERRLLLITSIIAQSADRFNLKKNKQKKTRTLWVEEKRARDGGHSSGACWDVSVLSCVALGGDFFFFFLEASRGRKIKRRKKEKEQVQGVRELI